MKTIVKVYLKDEHGNEDWFVTPINLPEQEAHENYIGKRFNIGIDTDHMMKWLSITLSLVGIAIFIIILFLLMVIVLR